MKLIELSVTCSVINSNKAGYSLKFVSIYCKSSATLIDREWRTPYNQTAALFSLGSQPAASRSIAFDTSK